MASLFNSSPAALLKKAEKLRLNQLGNNSDYIYLQIYPLNKKGNKFFLYTDTKLKLHHIYQYIPVVPVTDYIYKNYACHYDDLFSFEVDLIKVVELGPGYAIVSDTTGENILGTILIVPNGKDPKRRYNKIKISMLYRELMNGYIESTDKKKYLKELKSLYKTSKGVTKKAIKKSIEEIEFL